MHIWNMTIQDYKFFAQSQEVPRRKYICISYLPHGTPEYSENVMDFQLNEVLFSSSNIQYYCEMK